MLKRAFVAIKELVLPDICCLCGDALGYFSTDRAKIFFKGERISSPYCAACTETLMKSYYNATTDNFKDIKARFLFSYNHEITQKALLHLKRTRCIKCNDFFAKMLELSLEDEDFNYITYIPRSKSMRRKYAFDQSERICRTFVRLSPDHTLIELLGRSGKFSTQQKKLSARNRFINAKGSLILRKNVQVPKNIILFDDITTTGATANTAIEMLKKGGAENISLIFLAKAGKIKEERRKKENE